MSSRAPVGVAQGHPRTGPVPWDYLERTQPCRAFDALTRAAEIVQHMLDADDDKHDLAEKFPARCQCGELRLSHNMSMSLPVRVTGPEFADPLEAIHRSSTSCTTAEGTPHASYEGAVEASSLADLSVAAEAGAQDIPARDHEAGRY